jgi:hypothetical protein
MQPLIEFPDLRELSVFFRRCAAVVLIAPTMALAQSGAAASAASAAPAAPDSAKTVEINRAAVVVLVEGEVKVFDTAKKSRSFKAGDALVEGDSVVTGADGELHLNMEDGGYMAIRPNTRLRFTKYQAKGEDSDTSIIGLLQGSFRSVTGWIGKFNNNNYRVRTPTATIGIRGTDHEPLVVPPGATDQEPGTYEKVNEGGSFIHTPAGRTDVAPNQAGFVPHDGKAKPRLLAEIPKVFRRTRNEHLLDGKHAAIQKIIEKRREDRRREIQQRLAARKAAPAHRLEAAKERREAAKQERAEALKAKAEERQKALQEAKEKREAARQKKEEDEKENEKEHRKTHLKG